MKIVVQFDSEEEQQKILTAVCLVMDRPVSNLKFAELALVKYLEQAVKNAYIEGCGKQLQAEQQPKFAEEANSFFRKP